ncbi:unnamed protein product, partial [Polarella glacialis]
PFQAQPEEPFPRCPQARRAMSAAFPEMGDRSGVCDFRQEQSLLRKAADAEAQFRNIIEGKRASTAEKHLELQEKLSAAEEVLRREKDAVLEFQSEVSLERWEGHQE